MIIIEDRDFKAEFEFKSSRSGGKGGQNVNKVETRVELNFDILNSALLSNDEKTRILAKLKNRIDKNGILRIISQTERSQFLNKNKAVKRFYELIGKALAEEKIRKKTRLSKADKEKRLIEKKNRSLKKELRKIRTKDFDD